MTALPRTIVNWVQLEIDNTSFPTPDSVTSYQKITPNPQRFMEKQVGDD
jgi:hypothetical protein